MKIQRVPLNVSDLPAFSEEKRAKDAANRAPGVHLSDIIKYVMVRGYGRKYGDRSQVDVGGATKMDVGFMWEDIFVEGMRKRLLKGTEAMRGTEIHLDRIAMNPDLIVPDERRIEEVKWTKRSLRKFKAAPEAHFPDWIMQMQGYLQGCRKSLGLDIHVARLVPLFVCGDYSFKPPDGDTTLYVCDFTFEDWELDENWSMMLTNKAAMLAEIEGGTWR